MVDYFQPTKYPDQGFKLKAVHTRVHFTTNPYLWVDLSKYLRSTFGIKFIFILLATGRGVGLDAYFEARLRKYVDRPAEFLGLGKKQIRRRLTFYTPFCHYVHCIHDFLWQGPSPDSFLIGLAQKSQWDELAKRVLADEATIQAVFKEQTLKNTTTGEIVLLKDLVQSARDQLRDKWFTHIQQTDSELSYGLKPIPKALNIIPQILYNRSNRCTEALWRPSSVSYGSCCIC
ncbi:hypothetical protein MMC30_000861 [Trapelia coarctata]|nr:hypothetical protein [Trapelia coarctata]